MVESILIMGVISTFLLGIPMLATMIDAKQTTIQASRYAAWENTVYADPGQEVDQVKERFFGHTETPISSHVQNPGSNQHWGEEVVTADTRSAQARNDGYSPSGDAPPPSETPGLPLYERARISIYDSSVRGTASEELGLGEIAGTASSAIFSVTRALGGDGWNSLEKSGLYRSNVSVAIKSNELYNSETASCNGQSGFTCLSESTSLMVDGWSSGNTQSTIDRVHGFVPTNRLDKVGNFLSRLSAIPMISDLKGIKRSFGCVKPGVLPPKELDRQGPVNLPAYVPESDC